MHGLKSLPLFLRPKDILDRAQALRFRLFPALLQVKNFAARRPAARSGRLCLFAHFDPQGVIDPYVVQYLMALSRHCPDIVFVSTSPLRESESEKIADLCIAIASRANIGIDFGSWRMGIELAGGLPALSRYEEVLLANDSVYGPVFDLTEAFDKMRNAPIDIWGITDSAEITPHLQSYFLVFRKAALKSETFHRFWRTFLYLRRKKRMIERYELGISWRHRRAGLRLGAYIPYAELAARARALPDFQYREELAQGDLNPTLHLWDIAVSEFRCPFVKTELFKKNRLRSRAVHDWKGLLARAGSAYDPELIERHLKRLDAFSARA